MYNKIFFGIIMIFCLTAGFAFSNETPDTQEQLKKNYLKERLSFLSVEEFDQLYPFNIKKFSFYKGETKLSYNDFLNITNNSFLIKQNERINKIKINGFSTTGVFGGLTVAFLIPTVIFIAKQTNYNQVDTAYTFSGVAMVALTGVSAFGLIIALCTTFYLLYQNKYSVYPIRKAVEEYNENLRKKLGLIPDFSIDNDTFKMEIKVRI